MHNPNAKLSPQLYARTAGFLYLLVIILGGFAYGYVPGRLVSASVVTTGSAILTHETLWRIGVVAALLVVVCGIPQLLCEYLLLRPVQRNLALLAVFFNLISLTIESLSNIGFIGALFILKGRDSLSAVNPHQLQAWASLAIELHDQAVNISFLFFGCVCLLYGYLIFKSGFLPRFLGILMAVAGVCYAANSLITFMAIHLGPAGFPWLLLPAGLCELVLCLWLLIAGVNAAKWLERAGLAA
ncbi:MAG: DUF4386 domain-containing protein [Gammaproteobacteria bacterium]|nr:DUF4386 domain-containing protein [Gammaproteobacteria bacterium]